LRLVGHKDLARAMERTCRRAGLPMAFSEGFHPKPRINIPAALPLGMSAEDEPLEIELSYPVPAEEVLSRLTAAAPPGLSLRRAALVPPGTRKAQPVAYAYETPVRPDLAANVRRRMDEIAAAQAWPLTRSDGKAVDVKADLAELSVAGDDTGGGADGVLLRFRLVHRSAASTRPQDVVAAFDLTEASQRGHAIRRTQVQLADETTSGTLLAARSTAPPPVTLPTGLNPK